MEEIAEAAKAIRALVDTGARELMPERPIVVRRHCAAWIIWRVAQCGGLNMQDGALIRTADKAKLETSSQPPNGFCAMVFPGEYNYSLQNKDLSPRIRTEKLPFRPLQVRIALSKFWSTSTGPSFALGSPHQPLPSHRFSHSTLDHPHIAPRILRHDSVALFPQLGRLAGIAAGYAP